MATTITANGINFPDGSAGSPSIGGTDTNTGLFTGSDIVGFATGGSERLRIDASGNINIANDSGKLQLGTSADLKLYHDGSNSWLLNDTGNLILKDLTDAIYIQAPSIIFNDETTNENIARFISDGACELYYDDTKKLETTSSGVTVTGQLHVDGGYINLDDNYSYGMGTNNRAQLYHNGSNLYLFNTVGTTYIQPKAGENGIELIPDGSVKLYSNNLLRFETHSDGCSLRSTSYSNSAAHWVEGGLKPWANNTYDLGDASYRWRNIHCNDGILFQGNNTTATTLDDYEEGTFTATLPNGGGSVSIGSQMAKYHKIGGVVHVQIALSNIQNHAVVDMTIGGLPFTSSSSSTSVTAVLTNRPALSDGLIACILDNEAFVRLRSAFASDGQKGSIFNGYAIDINLTYTVN